MELPISATRLATRIGYSKSYIFAMKQAGYEFSHGSRTLPSHALKWLEENPGFRCTSYHTSITETEKNAQRERILDRDNHTCHYCFGPAKEMDHVVPRKGRHGDDSDGNMVACCRSCNAAKNNRPAEWFIARLCQT